MRLIFRSLRLLSPVLFFAGIVFAFGAVSAQAQQAPPLTAEQQQKIMSNCVSIKASLTQLHASDALLRVNRGQLYESMASKLMERFNDRLGGNSLDNRAMTTVTTNYRTQLTAFRIDYIAYEQKLSSAINIDCATKPQEFHNTLQEARTLRSTVHKDVKNLNQHIDDYRSSVGAFLVNYERLSK